MCDGGVWVICDGSRLFQRIEVVSIEAALAFGSVECCDAISISLLNLTTHNLHGAVHHTVLLGECLRQYSESAGQPTIGEELGQVATLLEAGNVALDELNTCLATLLSGEVEILLFEACADIVLIGHEQRYGIGRLVVVEDYLINGGEMLNECFFNAFGAVLLTIA